MLNTIILSAVDFYVGLVLIYVLMSWLPRTTSWVADVYRVLGSICEPYLGLFRRIIPPIGGMIDISPILAIVVLQLLARLLTYLF